VTVLPYAVEVGAAMIVVEVAAWATARDAVPHESEKSWSPE
jgi:hypothetical protein